MMNMKEVDRLQGIEGVLEKRLKQREAALQLGVGARQVKRLLKRYRESGAPGLVSGHRGKVSNRRIGLPVRSRIMDWVRDRQRGKPFRFERFLAHRFGQRPTDPRLLGSADKVRYGRTADSAAAGDLPVAQSVCFLHEGLL